MGLSPTVQAVGEKACRQWLDEVQDFPEDKFGSVIRPLVSSTNGNIVISGQFRGESCWYFKSYFVQGQSKYILSSDGVTPVIGEDGKPVENVLYQSWRIPSSEGLCFQGKMGRAELAEMKRTLLQAQWDIECECIARASLSAAFDQNQIRACIRGDNRPNWEEPIRGMAYVIGLDLGHTHDPSAYVILEVTTGRVVKVHQFPLRTKAEAIAHEVNLMAMKYNGAELVMDVTGQKGAAGGANGEHGDRRVQIITEAVNTRVHHEHINHPSKKHEYVKNLDVELANNKLTIRPSERLLIQEMQAFEYRNVGHYVQYGSPKSQTSIHDDTVMALCLALWGKRMGWYETGKQTGFNPYNM